MTQKSSSRRQRDAEAMRAAGGRIKTKYHSRENSTQCWYKLKEVHMRSAAYIEKLAIHFSQYMHPIVLAKIDKNGDMAEFKQLNAKIPEHMGEFAKRFQEMHDQHKDKRKLCLSYKEFEIAVKIFEAYQVFDIDFFNTFSPITQDMNAIFNKALSQLLEAQETLVNAAQVDPAFAKDIPFQEGELPKLAGDLPQPPKADAAEPQIKEEDHHINVVEKHQEPVPTRDVVPANNFGLISPQL